MQSQVLVVDDSTTILDLARQMLKFQGYEVLTAPDALTALTLLKTTRPDAILLDLLMPGMSGYDFIRELRQQKRAIPIVLLTTRKLTTEEIEPLKVAGYLQKPFHLRELLSTLKELLNTC